MEEDLEWLYETFVSYLMSTEHEYGGDKAEYRNDEKRAREIIDRVKEKLGLQRT
jgi:hypothetical protein